MGLVENILLRMFGRPRGIMGRLGGIIMARMNDACGAWIIELLEIESNESVLEVGYGPGLAIQRLARLAGHVAGVDPSSVMAAQARIRNAGKVETGDVELRRGSADSLPLSDNSFDKVMAINSMQVWSNAVAGLLEIRRVLKSGGIIALGFTPHSGQAKSGLLEKLLAAGFTNARIIEKNKNVCVLATKPCV
jgi:ubiquinone/menaquinone biosynthesis C-methylase UbiE